MSDSINHLRQITNSNLLYINLNGAKQSVKEFGAIIKEFASHNDKLIMIYPTHGFEVFPFSSHTIRWSGQEDKWEIVNYFASGNYIPTVEILTEISSSIVKPFDLWFGSCQGSKLISAAQSILPKGSIFVTES